MPPTSILTLSIGHPKEKHRIQGIGKQRAVFVLRIQCMPHSIDVVKHVLCLAAPGHRGGGREWRRSYHLTTSRSQERMDGLLGHLLPLLVPREQWHALLLADSLGGLCEWQWNRTGIECAKKSAEQVRACSIWGSAAKASTQGSAHILIGQGHCSASLREHSEVHTQDNRCSSYNTSSRVFQSTPTHR